MSGQGYYLEFVKPSSRMVFDHSVGGPHEVPGAVCNGHGCNRPFVRLLALDLRNPSLSLIPRVKRAEAGGVAAHQIPLFYCWGCAGSSSYRLESAGGVTVIGRGSTGPEKDFPYPKYPGHFPLRRAVLKPIPPDVQRVIQESNAETLDSDVRIDSKFEPHLRPHHQVGGTPYFVQGMFECADCSSCGDLMKILATAAADSGSKKPFVKDPFTQVVFEYCPRCCIVSASHQSD
jgi:hypothetical protein